MWPQIWSTSTLTRTSNEDSWALWNESQLRLFVLYFVASTMLMLSFSVLQILDSFSTSVSVNYEISYERWVILFDLFIYFISYLFISFIFLHCLMLFTFYFLDVVELPLRSWTLRTNRTLPQPITIRSLLRRSTMRWTISTEVTKRSSCDGYWPYSNFDGYGLCRSMNGRFVIFSDPSIVTRVSCHDQDKSVKASIILHIFYLTSE